MGILGLQIASIIFSIAMMYLTYICYKRKYFEIYALVIWLLIFIVVIITTLFPSLLTPFTKIFKVARLFDLFLIAGIFFLITITYINFIQDVAPHCDCAAPSGLPVVQDIGITLSSDPVAIDKASIDLVDQAPIIPGSTWAKPPDILGKIHNTNSLVQLQTAQKLGIGTMEYELISL